MTNRLLSDPDALTLILQQLRVENDLTTSLRPLGNLSAVNRYALEYLNTHNAELARYLLGVDIGMSPLALATMIRQMSPMHRDYLVHLAEQWNTPHVIEDEYFSDCAALVLPQLSSELTAIGRYAFAHCTALNVAEWHAPLLTSVGAAAFGWCKSMTLHTWHSPKLTALSVGAFVDCACLTLKTWTTLSLSRIDYGVFRACTALVLSQWDAPELTTIDDGAFDGCLSLTLNNWAAPKLKYIGYEAFLNCTSLVLPNGLQGDLKTMVIKDASFHGCTSLSEDAKDQIGKINPGAFKELTL